MKITELLRRIFGRKKPKIKVGLALGSGGAKGFAELGAIKVLEEHGIEFDVVCGTSIGSIIGAFIADGFTSDEIYDRLLKVDAKEVASKILINMDTAGLKKVIDRNIGSKKIEELKKPFAAAVTDMENNSSKIMYSGDVATVLCASASFPPYFKPVVIDGVKYIDGAFFNSVPADVCRELGADYVVGIDLSNHKTKKGFLDIILPTFKGGVSEPWQKGYENSDVMIWPDLGDYSGVSFSASKIMYEAGRTAAENVVDKIKQGIDFLRKHPKKKPKQKKEKKVKIKKEKKLRKKKCKENSTQE